MPTLDVSQADVGHRIDWLHAEGFLRLQDDGWWSITGEGLKSVKALRDILEGKR